MYDSKKILGLICLSALIFIALGYSLTHKGILLDGNSDQQTNQESFQAGWKAAKERLQQEGVIPSVEGMEMQGVFGEIIEVSADKIKLKIDQADPLSDPSLDNRIVFVRPETKIYLVKEKDPLIYDQEIKDYEEKVQKAIKDQAGSNEEIVPPDYYVRAEIVLDDLRTGQMVSAIAGEDISDKKQFEVLEIFIQEEANQADLSAEEIEAPLTTANQQAEEAVAQ